MGEEEHLNGSGEDEHGDSDDEVSTEEDATNAEPFAKTGSSKELDTETSDDENGHQHEESEIKVHFGREPSSDMHIEGSVPQRSNQPSAQLQAAEDGVSSRRLQLRARPTPSYAEKDSEEEEYVESSSEDEHEESDGELSIGQEVSRQKRKRTHMNGDEPKKKRGRAS